MSIKNRLEQLKLKKKETVERKESSINSISQDFLLEAARIINCVKTKLNDISEWFSLESEMQVDIVKKFVSEEIKDDQFVGINLDGLIAKILAQVNGYGVLDNIISDIEISKIFVNGCDYITVQKNRQIEKIPLRFENDTDLMTTIKRILSLTGQELKNNQTFYEGKLPDNLLFRIIMPPVSSNGITLILEKLKKDVLDLEHLIQADFLSFETAKCLEELVKSSKNILISGAYGVGKKTLLNALVQKIQETNRCVCVSDYQNALPDCRCVANYDVSDFKNDNFKFEKLFENIFIQHFDRLIIPNLHKNLVFEIIKIANVGQKGIIGTICANSKEDVFDKLLGNILTLNTAIDTAILEKRVAQTFDYLVYVSDSEIAKTVEVMEINYTKEKELKLKNILSEKTLTKKPAVPKKSQSKTMLKK